MENSINPDAGVESGELGGHGSCIPPPQQPYALALGIGFDVLLSRELSSEKLEALGVQRIGDVIRVPALNRILLVDIENRMVCIEDAGCARAAWALLAVHYLCAEDVSLDQREVSLAHFPECRGYLAVFNKRIIRRFLATSGHTAQQFERSSEQLHAERLFGPNLAFRFPVLPRVPITIARYEGDEELEPGANVIYRADAERLLPAEDCIVAAELVLDSLLGKPMEDGFGGIK